MPTTNQFSIHDAAAASGLTPSVIRVWEERYCWPAPKRHRNGYRTIQLHDGRGSDLREHSVQRCDAHPIRVVCNQGARVTGSDSGLQRVWAARAAQLFGMIERRKTTTDQESIPLCTILLQQQDRFALAIDAGARTRGLDFHQREQSVHLRFARREPNQHATQSQRLLA